MRELEGMVDGPLVVAEPLLLGGVVDGDVTVEEGGDLVVLGAVLGNVTVRGGCATVNGTVTGHVRNQAGELLVTGVIHRGVSTADGAEATTYLAPGACIWVGATLRGAVFEGEQRRRFDPDTVISVPDVSPTVSGSGR